MKAARLKILLNVVKKSHWIALGIFLFIALFSPFIANDKYIISLDSEGLHWFDHRDSVSFGIKALIPYSANSIDKDNRKVSPFGRQDISSLYYRHWLGTDSIGRDIFAGLIHGSLLALLIGAVSSILALIIGIFFAYLSGYLGDREILILKRDLWILIPLTLILLFYVIYAGGVWKSLLLITIILLVYFLYKRSMAKAFFINRISIPFDIMVLRLIEIFRSIPALFLILILLPILGRPSYWNVILIIALTRWPTITRHLRAEILNIKKENYISLAKSSGLSGGYIFFKYVLPLTISPIIIVTAFGFSSAILLESTLSFLGIGVPLDVVTWGGILKEARYNFSAWWLAVFPGLCIYFLIYLFNSIGDSINDFLLRKERG